MDGLQPTEEAIYLASTIILESIRSNTTLSPRDDSALSRLQNEIKIFDSAAVAIYEHLDREASKLRQQLNSHALIHRLPNEVLTHILLLDLRDCYVEPDRVRGRRKQLASVSHFWLQLLKQTPLLWTNVSSIDSEWDLALRKSKDAPLHVYFVSYEFDRWSPTSARFMKSVGSSARRWKSVCAKVDQDQHATSLQEGLQDATSTLQTLVLRNQTRLSELTVKLPETAQRSLRTVSLHQVAVGWNFSDLRSLELSTLRTAPTVTQLDSILALSPLLSRLALTGLTALPSNEPARSASIYLSRLLSLHVERCPKEYSKYLAATIRSPILKSLYFEELHTEVVPETAEGAFQLAMPVFQSHSLITLVCNDSRETVHVGSRDYRFTAGRSWIDPNQDDEFFVQIKTRAPMQILAMAAKAINTSNSDADIQLTVHGNHNQVDTSTPCCPPEILDFLPNMRVIETKCHRGAECFIKRLGETLIANDGQAYNPCPNLDFLDLSAVNIGRPIIEALQAKRVNRIPNVDVRIESDYVVPEDMMSDGSQGWEEFEGE